MYVIRNPIVGVIIALISLGGAYLIVTKVLDSTEKQTDKITRDINTQVDKALTNADEQRKDIDKAVTDAGASGAAADSAEKAKKIQADLQACIQKAGSDAQKAAQCSQKAAAEAASP